MFLVSTFFHHEKPNSETHMLRPSHLTRIVLIPWTSTAQSIYPSAYRMTGSGSFGSISFRKNISFSHRTKDDIFFVSIKLGDQWSIRISFAWASVSLLCFARIRAWDEYKKIIQSFVRKKIRINHWQGTRLFFPRLSELFESWSVPEGKTLIYEIRNWV